MIFNNSNGIMMTSFIIKEGTETIRPLDSANLNLLNVIYFTENPYKSG